MTPTQIADATKTQYRKPEIHRSGSRHCQDAGDQHRRLLGRQSKQRQRQSAALLLRPPKVVVTGAVQLRSAPVRNGHVSGHPPTGRRHSC